MPLLYRDGTPSGIEVTAFSVAGDPPRFARREEPGHTIGLLLRETRSGSRAAFVPGCGALDEKLLGRLRETDSLVHRRHVLGRRRTCDTRDQRSLRPTDGPRAGFRNRGKSGDPPGSPLPKSGLHPHQQFESPCSWKIPERREVEAAGILVGDDGMRDFHYDDGVQRIQADERSASRHSGAFPSAYSGRAGGGAARFPRLYYVEHPFHKLMYQGQLTPRQFQGWSRQPARVPARRPRKDAAILSNCPDPAVRREWIQRITDHDGTQKGEGGIEMWIRLGSHSAFPGRKMEDERHVLPRRPL